MSGSDTARILESALADIRLPPEAAGGAASDMLAALFAGLVLALAASLFFGRRRRPAAAPDPDPRRALMRKLSDRGHRFGPEIYRKGGLPDLETLRALDRETAK